MTVQDIFNLRKEGHIDEAWEAIQPMYAVHQGKHTTLAYFWTASDKLKQAAEAKDGEGARRLLAAMVKAYPNIEDGDLRANYAIIKGALRVDDLLQQFNLAYFMPYFSRLKDEDWKATKVDDHWVPALGQRIVVHLFRDLEDRDDAHYVEAIMPMLETALHHNPNDKNNLRILARIYRMINKQDDAEKVLRRIILKYKDSAACHELSTLVTDGAERIALLCQAILWQPQEKFRSKIRVELASLLKDKRKPNALYELLKSRKTREAMGNHVPDFALQMEQQLAGTTPATEQEQQDFYIRAIRYLRDKNNIYNRNKRK